MIKSIFFDVDGTLLSFKTHAMSEKTKEALEEARKKGIKLFIATGRSPKTFEIVKKTLGFEFDGYVMLNGQYCVVEDKVIHSMTLPKESLESIIPYLEKEKISCEFVELDYMYTNFVNERVIELRKFLGSTFMLEFVKIGVAMGNAGDNVKKSADYVTENVDDEGIYKALKKFEII